MDTDNCGDGQWEGGSDCMEVDQGGGGAENWDICNSVNNKSKEKNTSSSK